MLQLEALRWPVTPFGPNYLLIHFDIPVVEPATRRLRVAELQLSLCRARDQAGHEQPLEPVWNAGGYANNAVQRVGVTVRA